MTTPTSFESGSTADFEAELIEQTGKIKSLVDDGNISQALEVISQINQSRDQRLYVEVGHLTRSLYDSIRNFDIDYGTSEHREDLSKINDASDRLAYVVEMTSSAANKTMDLVEETMPYAKEVQNEAQQLKTEWDRLRRKEMKPEEFRKLTARMDTFLDKLSLDSDKVYRNLSSILLAQDYQDLTGQVIHRVTTLVKEVEESLVNLVRMAGKVDQIAGTVHEGITKADTMMAGEGPQMKAKEREDVMSSQDDVDDLLSSLGF